MLNKENLSERDIIELLISQYNWQFDYEVFKNKFIGDYFNIIIKKSQKITKEEFLELMLNIKEKQND